MLRDKITIDNDWYKKVLAFVGNPFTAIFVAILMSVFFYVISLSSKTPYYYLTTSKSLTEHSHKSLKTTFRKQSITNLYYADLVIWNNGNVYIDYNDFISSKPIVLKSKGSLRILACDILSKSRTDLQFSSKIWSDSIIIKMDGEEALEQGDGVSFRVFYTMHKISSTPFLLTSRIKGTTNGFVFKNLKLANRSVHTHRVIFGWCAIITLLLIRIITLFLVKKPIVFRRIELIVFFLWIIIWSYYTYEYIYFTTDINWYNAETNIPAMTPRDTVILDS